MKSGLFSICIPTYNRREKLYRAILSSLKQDYENLEIIVSDNYSTDGTLDMMNSVFENNSIVKYYRNNENVGMVANWRLCIERAQGEFYIILDDDNYLIYDNYISDAMNVVRSKKKISLIFGDFIIRFKHKDHIVKYNLEEMNDGIYIYSNYFRHKKIPEIFFTIMNRKFALENNFYSENIITHDVQSFLISMLGGNVGYINRVTGIYDITGDDNIIHTINNNWKHYVLYYNSVIEFAKRQNITSLIYLRPLKRQVFRSFNSRLNLIDNIEDNKWYKTQIKNLLGRSFYLFLLTSTPAYKIYKFFKKLLNRFRQI